MFVAAKTAKEQTEPDLLREAILAMNGGRAALTKPGVVVPRRGLIVVAVGVGSDSAIGSLLASAMGDLCANGCLCVLGDRDYVTGFMDALGHIEWPSCVPDGPVALLVRDGRATAQELVDRPSTPEIN